MTRGFAWVPVNVEAFHGLWGAVLVHARHGLGAVNPPAAPAGLAAEEGDGFVRLTWNKVTGADSYKVFRSYLSGGGYTKIAVERFHDVTGTTYTDRDVENGRIYFYVVRAVANGMESADSAEASAIPHHVLSGLLLQWPPSITHTIQAGQPTENIYAVEAFHRVRIKYVTVKPGATDGLIMQIGYGLPGTLPWNTSTVTWDTWQDMTFSKDYPTTDDTLKEWEEWQGRLWPDALGHYAYLVRASTTAGREWTYGGFRAGTSAGGILNVVPSSDTTPPAAPANLHVKGTTPASITLAWDANTVEAFHEPDLFGYELYRMPQGGAWARIATILAGAETYVDREVSTGSTYSYYLLAVDTVEAFHSYNRSTKSNEVTAKAEARLVHVTFNVTVPPWKRSTETPAPDIVEAFHVRMPGNQASMGPWDATRPPMNKVDATHWTLTMDLLDGTPLEYKYNRGSWDTVEWWADIHDLLNRHLTVNYGADGAQVINVEAFHDTVPLWRDPLVVSTSPAAGAAGVPANAVLSAVFSRAIQPEDLVEERFNLKTGDTMVAGTAAFDAATLTVTFTPAAPLLAGTTYTWTIGPGINGDAGSAMQNVYQVTFTTTP